MSENIVIVSIIFHRIEMENQNIGDTIRSEIMTDLRTTFPVTSNKLLYIESSDEEDGPSAMLNEKMDRTTVSLKHAHFLSHWKQSDHQLKRSQILPSNYTYRVPMKRTGAQRCSMHQCINAACTLFMPLEHNSGNSERAIDTRLSRGPGRAAAINNETGYSLSEILEDSIDQQRNVCNEHVSLALMLN